MQTNDVVDGQWRYDFLEEETDIRKEHLVIKENIRIESSSLVKKISDRVVWALVETPERTHTEVEYTVDKQKEYK